MARGQAAVSSLQGMDRAWRAARLLVHDDRCGNRRPVRRTPRGMGSPARDRRRVRSSADLRVAPIHHVRARSGVLFRPAEAVVSRAGVFPGTNGQGAAGAAQRCAVADEGGSHRPRSASRRGRGSDHRLAARVVRLRREARADGEAPRQCAQKIDGGTPLTGARRHACWRRHPCRAFFNSHGTRLDRASCETRSDRGNGVFEAAWMPARTCEAGEK
jgi:hypothetical protein